jgi:outer membrane PBP1 activator LpoA protein
MNDNQSTSALRRAARTLAVVLLLACAACTSVTPTQRPTGDLTALEERARAAAETGNSAAAADLYTQLAAASSGTARIDYLLEAARLAADYGDTALARRRINDARNGATIAQQQTSAVLLARLELADGRPQAALDMLGALPQSLPPPVQSDAAAVRGQALFRLGRPVEAVRVLVEREIWLGDAAAILANQRMIWDGFRQSSATAPVAPTGDTVIDGWLALAPLAASAGTDLRRSLLSWRQTYQMHPAAGGLLAELLAAQRSASFPSQIALLLPLSSQRAVASAIRDGFMAAHLGNPSNTQTNLRVYDSARLGSQQAYLQAQLDGADFIVGPLLFEEVDQVITQAGFVPTLALNFATNDTTVLSSFYQFALAPEDEARTIAAAATAAGAKTAVVFAPSNPRGNRIKNDFQAAFQEAGGEVLDWYPYEPALQDFSQPVAALFNVTRSRDRHRRLAANLGVAVQFPEARRRQDVDMIFVVANPLAGRSLASQLRFFGASNIPMYATAEIYDLANTGRDNDLNGFIIADTPALLLPDADASAVRAGLEAHWPQRTPYLRFYDMGFDAYDLIAPLYANGGEAWSLRGLSGDLSLDAQGRVRRVLPLAQFRNGRPVALDGAGLQPIDSRGIVGQR